MSDARRHAGRRGTASELAELARLRPALRVVTSKPAEYEVHAEFTVELTLPAVVVRVGTGWDTFVEIVGGAGVGADVQIGDRLAVVDWGIDNYGPEGQVVEFRGAPVVAVGRCQLPASDPAATAETAGAAAARRFASALVALTGAPSFSALVVAHALFADEDDEFAVWRTRNLAASAVAGGELRSWSAR